MMSSRNRSFLLFLATLLAACQSHHIVKTPHQTSDNSQFEYLDQGKLAQIDLAIEEAIAKKKTPGGVLWIERKGQIYHKAFGHQSLFPKPEKAVPDTIYDLASLTKVIATAPAIIKLHEQGRLSIYDPVAKYLPTFSVKGKDEITIWHLLTHTSGLPPSLILKSKQIGKDHIIKIACDQSLQTEIGTEFAYSDIGFILLGEIVKVVSGKALNEFVKDNFYESLKMFDTEFLPKAGKLHRIAPTTKTEKGVRRGIVHDPTADQMGGVAGHAGLFSTAKDLAQFARMLLGKGRLGTRVLKSKSVDLMTCNHSSLKVKRGLGWDISSPFSSPRGKFETGSYGHTGWTGTSIWIDPFSETFVIFLSNRNHPTEAGNVISLRRRIGNLAAESVIKVHEDHNDHKVHNDEFDHEDHEVQFDQFEKKHLTTLNGIDVFKRRKFDLIQGLSVGLITNHTGRSRENESTIELLEEAEDVDLAVIFSPEHGLEGDLDGFVNDEDGNGIPIYSLYGKNMMPTPSQLEGLDVIIFDIQDIGCRFYTYISTMGLAMEAASKAKIRFIVLDRPNPISGSRIEGPLLSGKTSFVGYHSLPLRHGMTVGELAKLFVKERSLDLDLKVIRLKNWDRKMWFDETGITWINPSPNMRNLNAAALYPGIGLLEMAEISVGRGTEMPFEIIGAPYINSQKLAREIDHLELPGIIVHPVFFTPKSSIFANELCAGIAFKIFDRDEFAPIDLGLNIAKILHRDYPKHFDLKSVNRLLKHEMTLKKLIDERSFSEIKKGWIADLEAFQKRRKPHLLY